jgi:hypothetical protein
MRVELRCPVSGTGERWVELVGPVTGPMWLVRLPSTGRVLSVWFGDIKGTL